MKNYLNTPNRTLSYLLTLVAFASFFYIACYKPYLLYSGSELYPFCKTAAECSEPLVSIVYLPYKLFWLFLHLTLASAVALVIQNFAESVKLGRDQYLKEQEGMRLLNEQKAIEISANEKNIICTKCKCKSCADPEPKKSDGTLWFFIPILITFAFIF